MMSFYPYVRVVKFDTFIFFNFMTNNNKVKLYLLYVFYYFQFSYFFGLFQSFIVYTKYFNISILSEKLYDFVLCCYWVLG